MHQNHESFLGMNGAQIVIMPDKGIRHDSMKLTVLYHCLTNLFSLDTTICLSATMCLVLCVCHNVSGTVCLPLCVYHSVSTFLCLPPCVYILVSATMSLPPCVCHGVYVRHLLVFPKSARKCVPAAHTFPPPQPTVRCCSAGCCCNPRLASGECFPRHRH